MADPFSYAGPEESGARLAEQDLAKLAYQGAQTEMVGAHARLYGSMANEHEMKTRKEQLWLDASRELAGTAAKGPNGEKLDIADQMDEMARRAMGAGFITQGSTLAQNAGTVRNRNAQATQHVAQAAEHATKEARQDLEMQEGMLRDATDESSWQRGQRLYEMMSGRRSPFRGMAYSPELVSQLGTAVTSKQSQLTNEVANMRIWSNRETADAVARSREVANELRERRLAEDERHHREVEKNAGKPKLTGRVGEVSQRWLEASDTLLESEDIFKSMEKNDRKLASQSIASLAREKQFNNRALGMEQALQQAFMELQQAGAFPTTQTEFPVVGTVGSFGKKTLFKGKGLTLKTPIPLPDNEKALVKNRYYNTKRGVALWNGAEFETAGEED